MAQVKLNNVTKVYPGDIEAVRNFNLAVENKEFVVLVGPSGCGKSTTLKMIAGLENVTEGEIYIGDKIVNHIPPKDRDIAMVFQNYALYPHMTVYGNMAFGLRLRKYPKQKIKDRVEEAADILGIPDLLDRRPKELSGGQRQRVAVGRAIVRKPLVFLFDEPLSNLDAKLRDQMRTELNKLHIRLQTTMIYVTHDQIEAMTLGDKIAVLKDGWIKQVDSPNDLYMKPKNKFVAGFIGSPPMNFMDGRIIKQDGKYYFDEGTFKTKIAEDMIPKIKEYESKNITFGIRSEDIYDKLFASDVPPENTVKVNVEVVEPRGADVHLYLNTGKNNFIAKVDPKGTPEVNQDLELVFDMNKVHFFDKKTEKAIV